MTMERGSHEDEELAFTLAFPLPYRVFVLIGLGILGWASNLHGLSLCGIDPSTVLELRPLSQRSRSPLPAPIHVGGGYRQIVDSSLLYVSLYRMFWTYSLCCSVSWACFRYATGGQRDLIDAYGYIPGTTALVLVAILICPFNILFKSDRDRFLQYVSHNLGIVLAIR